MSATLKFDIHFRVGILVGVKLKYGLISAAILVELERVADKLKLGSLDIRQGRVIPVIRFVTVSVLNMGTSRVAGDAYHSVYATTFSSVVNRFVVAHHRTHRSHYRGVDTSGILRGHLWPRGLTCFELLNINQSCWASDVYSTPNALNACLELDPEGLILVVKVGKNAGSGLSFDFNICSRYSPSVTVRSCSAESTI